MKRRRFILWVICLLGVGIGLYANPTKRHQLINPKIDLIEIIRKSPTIQLPSSPTKQDIATAQLLKDSIHEITGLELEVIEPAPAPSSKAIFTLTRYNNISSDAKNAILDEAKFAIIITHNNVHIHAHNDRALFWATAEFLRRYAGARWYMPGKIGEHFPKRKKWILKPQSITLKPAFESRALSGIQSQEGRQWSDLQGLALTHNFHHNLHSIYTPKALEHYPDAYSKFKGKQVSPYHSATSAQPNFISEDAVDLATAHLTDWFNQNARPTYSLGINDSSVYDSTKRTRKQVEPLNYFRNRPDFSPLVWDYMNKVAESLESNYPDRFIGGLAYHFAENVPPFAIHPKVLPYLTSDRSQWYDEAYKQEDQYLMHSWAESGAEKIGIYDYYYGWGFLFPRIYTEIQAQSIRHAYKLGFDGFYAELYPIWHWDSYKAWLIARLLWNPDQSLEKLKEDYFENFFGEGDKAMRAFYDAWEAIWMRQSGKGEWIRYFYNPMQFELFTLQELDNLESLLKKALSRTTGLQAKRVNRLYDGFLLTRYYAELYHAFIALKQAPPTSIELFKNYAKALYAFEQHCDTLMNDSELPLNKNAVDRFIPIGSVFQAVKAFLETHTPETFPEAFKVLESLDAQYPSLFIRYQLPFIAKPSNIKIVKNLLKNPNFDKPLKNQRLLKQIRSPFVMLVRNKNGWSFSCVPDATTTVEQLDASEGSSAQSVSIKGATHLKLYQTVSITPQKLYKVHATLKGKIPPSTQVILSLDWLDKNNNVLASGAMDRAIPGDFTQKLEDGDIAPENAHYARVNLEVIRQNSHDQILVKSIQLLETEPQ